MAGNKLILDFEKPIKELEDKIKDLRKLTETTSFDLSPEISIMEEKVKNLRCEIFSNLTPVQTVQVARHLQRPTTLDYISLIFENFIELHGDRSFSDDHAIVAGLAQLEKQSVAIVGHQKGKNTKDNLHRNFGMPHPEGYRKALRIMKLAEKFNHPVISFVDTPGAYPGIGAEERGQAGAIAHNLLEMANLSVPVIVVINGEGGSGGALGIAVGDRVLIFEHAFYSVISPEGCAAILWRDVARAPEAAENLHLTAKDLKKLGVVDEIIKEPLGGNHNDYSIAAGNLKEAIWRHLSELEKINSQELLANRYLKFRKMGEFNELKS